MLFCLYFQGRNFKRNVLYTHFIVCLVVVIIAVITVAAHS